MPTNHAQLFELPLLPPPQHAAAGSGVLTCDAHWTIVADTCDARVRREAQRVVDAAGTGDPSPNAARACNELRITEDRKGQAGNEAYTLTVVPGRVEIVGGSSGGCFYGLQTLRQLLRACPQGIPCGRIQDGPDLATRGLLHDVSRGKVPTLATLKRLVDKLAEWKMNQLQLYVEHAFVFEFDRTICDDGDGLTRDEVAELDRYCSERFVQLVPAAATFGHMGRILSLPKYAHLAEIAPELPWEQQPWPKRARGLTLDCANPQSRELVAHIWSELLAAFSSPIVNICGDEPWDLGKGTNKGNWTDRQQGEHYLDHVMWTHEFCAVRARRTQFWSDVLLNYPELFHRIPRDATVLHWGYDDNANYAATARLVEAGVRTIVCPGTSGWKRTINAWPPAEQNITRYIDVAHDARASGCLVTDWGDHGHFNVLAGSLHPIALAAANAWSKGHTAGDQFDRIFATQVPECGGAEVISAVRRMAGDTWGCETWRLFWMPAAAVADEPSLSSLAQAVPLQASAQTAANVVSDAVHGAVAPCPELRELELACRFTELFARKAMLMHQRHQRSPDGVRQWADDVRAAGDDYADVWLQRNKRSGLEDIRRALNDAARDLTEYATGCANTKATAPTR